jgi:hypothetical protein
MPPDQVPEATAAKVSAGMSPRLIALGLAVVLVAVVYVGVTGQGAAPTATAAPADRAIGAASTALPAFPSGLDAYPGVYELLDRDGAGSSPVNLAIDFAFGGRTALAALAGDGPNQYHAAYGVPLPVPATDATLELRAYATPSETYGRWVVPLAVFDANAAPGALLIDDVRRPEPDSPLASSTPLFRNGYRLEVGGERNATGGQLNIEVTIGTDPIWPAESYDLRASGGSQQFTGRSEVVGPGQVWGEIEFPDSFTGRKVDVDLALVAPDAPGDGRVIVASYEVDLPRPNEYPNGVRTQDVSAGPSAGGSDLGIVANGYRLKLIGAFDRTARVLFYELDVSPAYDRALFPVTAAAQ